MNMIWMIMYELFFVYRSEYKLGNRILLNVIATGISASQNRHAPQQQYVTRKKEVAYRNKKAELFCIFGGENGIQGILGFPGKFSKRI